LKLKEWYDFKLIEEKTGRFLNDEEIVASLKD
jgi:hypothetical protein